MAEIIQKWKELIANGIRYDVSNGKIEWINNKIKMMKRRAVGYRT
ncbi:transposase [Guptibacillus hwajinpoensis]